MIMFRNRKWFEISGHFKSIGIDKTIVYIPAETQYYRVQIFQ